MADVSGADILAAIPRDAASMARVAATRGLTVPDACRDDVLANLNLLATHAARVGAEDSTA